MNIKLRKVEKGDLDAFFINHQDKDANVMAAFTSKDPNDRSAFDTHWDKIFANEETINRTILYNDEIAGVVSKFVMFDEPEITYWIGKQFWGKGIATEALRQFLEEYKDRPLFGRTAFDNIGSMKVLEKNGFKKVGTDKGFANARGKEIKEFVFKLE